MNLLFLPTFISCLFPFCLVIMTGVDIHENGMGTMDVVITPNQVGKPGYETYLNDKVTTIAQILKDSGYHTYTTGKWHLGDNQENWPYNRGFEKVLHYYMVVQRIGMVQYLYLLITHSG